MEKGKSDPVKTLIVLTGPTGVGKTDLSLHLAESLGSPIISCDSRQIYREIPIGTAAPTIDQLMRVKHYFVGCKSVHDYYSAAKFEVDVINLLDNELFKSSDTILMTGGSMMYIDAVCRGIDDMPDVDEKLRKDLVKRYENEGIDNLLAELKLLDPNYYMKVDLKNHKRIIHGLEICLMTGKPYSKFRTGKAKQRSFEIIKICLNRDRKDLYNRIDARVEKMIKDGLMDEAAEMYKIRDLNSLNTVGYKEIFAYMDGSCTKDEAITNIKNNTHKYARKQLTWFRKDLSYNWFNADENDNVVKYLSDNYHLIL
jgi:tRNA dimethylallyltransferase